ncbi:MAG: hypothetical protein LE168_03815 [Endomicrobium sp.]|nr:hypothetical protein [Endomicrobium sp.]
MEFHKRKKPLLLWFLQWLVILCSFGVVTTDANGKIERFLEKPS